MSKTTRVMVYPKDQDFEIRVGSRTVGSRTYANSSNTYRGARAAVRNLRAGNVTNESNYGDNTLAIVNSNGFVIAANEFGTTKTAKKAAHEVFASTRRLKAQDYKLEVIND